MATKKASGRTSIQIRFMAGYQMTMAASRATITRSTGQGQQGSDTPWAIPWRARVTSP